MAENIVLTESTYYIMLSLTRPLHGYGIMQRVSELSGGRVLLAAGTLYGALNSLVSKGWIVELAEEPESRRRSYQITDDGMAVLSGELARLRELISNGEKILEEVCR